MSSEVGFMELGTGTHPEEGRVEDVTPREFMGLRDDVASRLGEFMQTGGPSFEGEFTADMTGQEQQLLSQVGRSSQFQPSEQTGQAMETLSSTAQGEFLSPDSNPALQQSIEAAQRPVIQQFEQEAMPRLRSEFTQAGQRIQPQGSSPFDRAAGIAQQGLTQELGDISSEMTAQNFQQERDRQQQAAQAVPQLGMQMGQQELESAIQGMEASALPRMIEQQGIDRGLEEFRRQTDAMLSSIQAAGQLSTPTTETIAPTPGMPGTLHSFLQGGGSAMGSFS